MSENDGGDVGAFLAGFVIGGLVGAAAALILAPQSGAETRERLAARSADLRRASEERLMDARSRAGEMADTYRDRGSEFSERARIVLDEGKSKLGEIIDTSKERVAQTRTDLGQHGPSEDNEAEDAAGTAA